MAIVAVFAALLCLGWVHPDGRLSVDNAEVPQLLADAPAEAAPPPRVCWTNDYSLAVPALVNSCDYLAPPGIWVKRVAGKLQPADELELPIANLCVYFAGTRCPPSATQN